MISNTVRGNRWTDAEMPAPDAFVPTEGVSVVLPYFESPDALALTLAGLEAQTYPRDLFEVIIVDDGSAIPLEIPTDTPLDVTVLHQENLGFGAPRARNAGVAAAAHDIVVFLDADMIPEPQLLVHHARWHHFMSDAVTQGFRAHVEAESSDADRIRLGAEPLKSIFAGRRIERPEWIEFHMSRTKELTSTDDDIFRVVTSGNLGARRSFFEEAGGFDESFTQWGAEDTEFGYRAYSLGGLLVPVRDAFCWHQGLGTRPTGAKAQSLELQRATISHLIAHPGFRRAMPGRSFTIPQYVVSVEEGDGGPVQLQETLQMILANGVHDLVVWIDRPTDPDAVSVVASLEQDPRVRVGDAGAMASEFPASSYFVSIPAASLVRDDAISSLTIELRGEGAAHAKLENGGVVTIARGWAVQRAGRRGVDLKDVCFPRSVNWRHVGISSPGSDDQGRRRFQLIGRPGSTLTMVQRRLGPIRRPSDLLGFLRWFAGAVRNRLAGRARMAAPAVDNLDSGETSAVGSGGADTHTSLSRSQRLKRFDTVTYPPFHSAVDGDWRTVEPPALSAFVPTERVSVLIRAGSSDDDIERTTEAIRRQTYPSELIDVCVVVSADGQEMAGARADALARAAGNILVFIDAGSEPDDQFVAAHARWHHHVADVLTLGSGTASTPSFTDVSFSNLGVRRELFEATDEAMLSEHDIEFGFRAYALGALLVPEPLASLATAADVGDDGLPVDRTQIAHAAFRPVVSGRSYAIPLVIVSVVGGSESAERVLECVESVLASDLHDLVVWLEGDRGGSLFDWLVRQLAPDPRVHFGPGGDAALAFPASPFHVQLPAAATIGPSTIRGLLAAGEARGSAVCDLDDGSSVFMTRSSDVHRARRLQRPVTDFSDSQRLTAQELGIRVRGRRARSRRKLVGAANARKALKQASNIRSPRQAWRFGKWVVSATRHRLGARPRRTPDGPLGHKAEYELGVEISTVGTADSVFAASIRVSPYEAPDSPDIVIGPTAADRPDEAADYLALDEAPPLVSVSAFDPLSVNPVGWVRNPNDSVIALGRREQLPPGITASDEATSVDLIRLRSAHHLVDVGSFHASPSERAALLVSLAARGIPVFLADGGSELTGLLGLDLHQAMADPSVRTAILHDRETQSVQTRHLALRDHSLRARARQIVEVTDRPRLAHADVSILLTTNRPDHLDTALDAVERQTYPRLELVLALHGPGFSAGVEDRVAALGHASRVVRVGHELSFGDALNVAVSASSGSLLTKFDDDDHYAANHVWDLVLAHEYSGAQLVGKAAEFVYLAQSDTTIHRFAGRGESYSTTVAGGAILIGRDDLEAAGGWQRIPRGVDRALITDVQSAGGRIYRTHGFGYVLVRHGVDHTWETDDSYFRDQAEDSRPGLDLGFAGL